MTTINVLDKGYVRYVKHMGDDLDVVNSAKVSFMKQSHSFEEKEARLLQFLSREEHTSTFRHSAFTLEVYAPLFVARQWWKYAVASTHLDDQNGWNESSRRYVTEEPEFYIPLAGQWRAAPENKKQGSGTAVDAGIGTFFTESIKTQCVEGVAAYEAALANGICAEQARLFLPAYALYVRWRWTASLCAGIHFLHQRLGHDAQMEMQWYAQAVHQLLSEHFPKSMELVKT